jgi:serine/threonine protein kinase
MAQQHFELVKRRWHAGLTAEFPVDYDGPEEDASFTSRQCGPGCWRRDRRLSHLLLCDGSPFPWLMSKKPPPTLQGNFSRTSKDFVELRLRRDPRDRPSAKELLSIRL